MRCPVRFSGMRGVLCLVGAVLCVAASAISASERVITWVDESGQVRYTVVKESEPEPLRARTTDQKSDTPGQPDSGKPVPADADQSTAPSEKNAEPESGRDQVSPESTGRQSVVFHQDGRVELDGELYEDAAALEARGFTRRDRPRFFTWIDATGQARSDVLPVPEDGAPKKNGAEKVSVQSGAASQTMVLARAVSAGDDIGSQCCDQFFVDSFNVREWTEDESDLLVQFEQGDELLTFLGGDTPYRVIVLPEARKRQTFKVRTFVSERAVYPTILTLDAQRAPLRLISDIVYRYEPETWLRHAFLEGYIQLEAKERYLVLLVANRDLERQTVTLGLTDSPIIVRHGTAGQLYLERVALTP